MYYLTIIPLSLFLHIPSLICGDRIENLCSPIEYLCAPHPSPEAIDLEEPQSVFEKSRALRAEVFQCIKKDDPEALKKALENVNDVSFFINVGTPELPRMFSPLMYAVSLNLINTKLICSHLIKKDFLMSCNIQGESIRDRSLYQQIFNITSNGTIVTETWKSVAESVNNLTAIRYLSEIIRASEERVHAASVKDL